MSSAGPTELNATGIITNIEAGIYPREMIVTVARGFLPLPQEDLITVLAYLSTSPDREIAEVAHASLGDVPARIVHAFASNEQASSAHLEILMRATNDRTILEALVRNRAVSDESIAVLARKADPHVQEVIVINQQRILRAPHILDALLENPQLSPDARRRALEVKEEFFEKQARLALLAEESIAEAEEIDAASLDAIRDLLEQAEAAQVADKVEAPMDLTGADTEDPTKVSTWAQLAKMTVGQKVQLAYKGNKTVRSILVRERNRLVSSAAMRNPRMTESEVEQIAGLRNVEEEVLRVIGMRRDWTSKYNIALALARNPKAPVGVVLPLINRLTLRDLKGLKDDKGVSEAVRANARKMFQAKQKS
jgi:hypothetical protein